MDAKSRLNLLNRRHGIDGNIHLFNLYYGRDLIRSSRDDFRDALHNITVFDVLRVRLLHNVTDNSTRNAIELTLA